MTEQRGYRVVGRVQGVGFRWWTQRHAVELGLSGTVRNRSDGSVEVQASGSVEQLDALESGLRLGPAVSRVESVEPIPPSGDLPVGDFLIEGW